MAIVTRVFNLLVQTLLTERHDWLSTERAELALPNGEPYATLVIGYATHHVYALLTTKTGASWRVKMRPDQVHRQIPRLALPEEPEARKQAKTVMRDLLGPFKNSDDVRVRLSATAVWDVYGSAPVGDTHLLGRIELRATPRMIFDGEFLLSLFWNPG